MGLPLAVGLIWQIKSKNEYIPSMSSGTTIAFKAGCDIDLPQDCYKGKDSIWFLYEGEKIKVCDLIWID